MIDAKIVSETAALPFTITHSPLPFQGEASVGSSSARHVANAAAGRSKHAAREIVISKRSTGHASETFCGQNNDREYIDISFFQTLTLAQ